MIDPHLQDKVALITGANNRYGIGVATAMALAAQGAAVFLHYYRRQTSDNSFYWQQQRQTAEAVVQEIRQADGRAACFEADLRDPAVVPILFDRAEATWGAVDILINNAACSYPDTFMPANESDEPRTAVDGEPMHGLTAESHDMLFQVNARATALMMAEFAKRHVVRRATWGRIVNISSDGASAFATQVSYGASKQALESYSKAAALELGRYGITVNIASLGPIQTGWISPELAQTVAQNTPLGRVGQPADVADVILFLASEQARWLTGQLLYVGGGHAMPR